jgi:hypothetical protein
MTKLEQLFIRACKSAEPRVRVASVYRRFYGKYATAPYNITAILAEICDKYAPIRAAEFIDAFNPANLWKYDPQEKLEHYIVAQNILISKIRYTKASDLKGLTPPVQFRRAA